MLGKLLYGRFSLKETFWKFGVLGGLCGALVMYIVKLLLKSQLGGRSIAVYYLHYFSPLNMNGTLMFLTLLYFLGALILCSYMIIVLFGVWRSSAEYDRSVWLRHIARLLTLVLIYFVICKGL
jgi:hypothetical protein